MTWSAFMVVMPNAMSVGGTDICSKVPDIESLPPIEGNPNAVCIFSAPNKALSGLPQLRRLVMRSKYSW